MKKLIVVVMLIFCLSLCACGEAYISSSSIAENYSIGEVMEQYDSSDVYDFCYDYIKDRDSFTNLSQENEPDLFKEAIQDYLHDNDELIVQIFENNIDGYLAMYPETMYTFLQENGDYPDLMWILDEADGNPTATKLLFDLVDELGYWPSAIFGDYCYDNSKMMIHRTDSKCVEKMANKNFRSFWSYWLFTLDEVNSMVEKSQNDWSFCKDCFRIENNKAIDNEKTLLYGMWEDTTDSSAIKRIGYSYSHKLLGITFRTSGETYYYYDVPSKVYSELMRAESAGSYFNEFIKNNYEYRKAEQ